MSYWENKTAIVTGAASGIGRALAARLVRCGARVWVCDIEGVAAEKVARALGHGARGAALDVTDLGAVKALVGNVVAGDGRLDAIFNNAGIGVAGELHEFDEGHFDGVIDVNIRGVVHGIIAAYPHMRMRRTGAIVNTASAAGLLGVPLMAPYAMTKHAIVGLSSSIRLEAAEHNVRVCVLCPAAIETPMLDAELPRAMGRIWHPDIRTYIARIGGAPYPVDAFAAHALRQIERDKGIIVAPLEARVRLAVGRVLPGLTEYITRKAMREAKAGRNAG